MILIMLMVKTKQHLNQGISALHTAYERWEVCEVALTKQVYT